MTGRLWFMIDFHRELNVRLLTLPLGNQENYMKSRINPISKERPLILASASPRRVELLRQVGVPFIAVPSLVEENGTAVKPAELAVELAMGKALEVAGRVTGHWVLGADTVVVVEGEILGKPMDEKDAARMLRLLSGRPHFVTTGFAVVDPAGGTAHSQAPTTEVRVKTISENEISGYIATGEPFGKAGAYAVQGIGAFLVEGLKGSYTNVVGLPLFHVLEALVRTGAVERFPM